jgi:PrtD family type I secretion system ABC transporter
MATQSAMNTSQAPKPIRDILVKCRRTFYFAFLITFVTDVLSITPIVYMMNVYDRVISSRSGVTLVSLTLIVIAMYIFWSAMEWVRTRLLVSLSLRIDWDLGAKIFDASYRRHVLRQNTDVNQLLNDMLILRNFFTGQPLITLMDAPFALVFITIGGIFHPYLAIFAAVASVLILLAALATNSISGPILQQANDSKDEATRTAAESLKQAESTLALGMLPAIRSRWYKKHRTYLMQQVAATESAGITGGISGFLQKALPSLQMALAAWLAMNNLITGGMVIAATMLIGKAVSPIQKLIINWKDIVSARQSYERLNALLAEDIQREEKMKLPPAEGRLSVEKAASVPPGAKSPVLVNIDFAINPGEAMAIVGPIAAGKTSLVRMLVGIWKPAAGHVRLDGVEISDWDHADLGPQIGYVPQDIELYEGTIAHNIARLNEPDPEQVIEAAKMIGIHEEILSFPKGYDTQLGSSGFALSGGQRQRVAIARAFYGMPKYLVMDEPNANLDDVGEGQLAEAISRLKAQGSTIVITSHRPRLVSMVDKLLVLRNGQQVGFGPAKAMLESVRNMQVAPSPEASTETKASPPEKTDEVTPAT